MLFELTMRQPPPKSRFSDTRVAHKHDLSSGVFNRRCDWLFEKEPKINFVDIDNRILEQTAKCYERQAWMKS